MKLEMGQIIHVICLGLHCPVYKTKFKLLLVRLSLGTRNSVINQKCRCQLDQFYLRLEYVVKDRCIHSKQLFFYKIKIRGKNYSKNLSTKFKIIYYKHRIFKIQYVQVSTTQLISLLDYQIYVEYPLLSLLDFNENFNLLKAVHTHIYTHTHTHTCSHRHSHIYILTYTHTYIDTHAHIYT